MPQERRGATLKYFVLLPLKRGRLPRISLNLSPRPQPNPPYCTTMTDVAVFERPCVSVT